LVKKNAALSSANRHGATGKGKEFTAMAAGESKTIQVIGIPMNLGTERRGMDLGRTANRIAGLLETVSSFGYRVEDAGDIAVRVEDSSTRVNPHLKNLDLKNRCTAFAVELIASSIGLQII
jgi:arginase family enzyme